VKIEKYDLDSIDDCLATDVSAIACTVTSQRFGAAPGRVGLPPPIA
jgi:hypothetical protein